MNFSDLFIALAQQSEVDKPSLFPFPFGMHISFACLGLLFFAYRFYTQKRPFQLIMAIAIPLSLVVWLSESRVLFYGLGIAELLLMLTAIVTSFIFKAPSVKASSSDEDDDDNDEDDADADDDGGDE